MSLIERTRSITENPWLNLGVGVIFMLTGVSETYEIIANDLSGPAIGVHHGAILFGLVQIAKTVPDFFEGLEYVDKSQGN